ncbi:3828_t:CDS:10 [Paraglomus brasilianum]|uniref:3828_t:CDS:1 n=1 Tax=Paraglomus brasilianum TaxID=144538 RepID=A0A9N9BCR9_9GLOM|nr:3828_t:CDS:10 [Paraglomus brasilianum]
MSDPVEPKTREDSTSEIEREIQKNEHVNVLRPIIPLGERKLTKDSRITDDLELAVYETRSVDEGVNPWQPELPWYKHPTKKRWLLWGLIGFFIVVVVVVDNSSAATYYKQHASTWSKAFTVDFRGPDDYVKELDRRLNQMASNANTTTYFNYVTIIQASSYGKTRSILQLTHWRPLIYVCFRKDDSSGYPAATPQSKVMLADINSNRADSIDNAHGLATIHDPNDLATKFWNTVSEEQTVAIKTKDSQRDIEGDIGTGYGKLHECLRIIIFFDEASALLDKYTNSAVSNLAPWKEHDPSARDYNHKVHQPFIYIATMDCFRESEKIPQEKVLSGHDIVHFGWPLWGSYWESLEQSDETKFKDIVIGSLAQFKLLGISSEASYLIKSHMAMLIAIDEEHRRHLIKYPSEPVLSEAAMELLSEDGAEYDILTELDRAFQSGAGSLPEGKNEKQGLVVLKDAIYDILGP